MGDGDHRPPGHRPGERHHPGGRRPDLRPGSGRQIDPPVPGAPRPGRCLEAADHRARPAARTVHRPRPPTATSRADLTRADLIRADLTPATRRVPQRPGPPGGQQRAQYQQHHQQHPSAGSAGSAGRGPGRSPGGRSSRASHAAEGPRPAPTRPPLPRFLWTTRPCGPWPSLQRVYATGFTRARQCRPAAPDQPCPGPPAACGVARRSALPVHFTRDPVRRVDFARPATGGRKRLRRRPRQVRVPLGPPSPAGPRTAGWKRLGTFGASGVAVTWPPRTNRA